MKITHLTRADYRRMRWRNDGGSTTEIARHPRGADDAPFDWRVSLADIERDGEFSHFDDCDRSLILLEGAGIEMFFETSNPVLLHQRGQLLAFRGDEHARCKLIDGTTRDFNVFTRRAVLRHKAFFRPLVGPMVLFPGPDTTWIVFVVSGTVQQQHAEPGVAAHAGDTLILEAQPGGRQIVLSGGGELVLVKIEPG